MSTTAYRPPALRGLPTTVGLPSARPAGAPRLVPVAPAATNDASPPHEFVWTAMPLGPATPAARLAALAAMRHTGLHERIAAHPAAPAQTLAQLARDPSPLVRVRVARHPRTPLPTRLALRADPHPAVRRALPRRRRLDAVAAA